MKKIDNIEELVQGVLEGNRRKLAKAISLIESTKPENIIKSQILIEKILPYTGKSYRIGITGTPGVGKSTFIESFGLEIVENIKRKLAIIAIDPSSKKTGGSILGDKTRMIELGKRKDVFIRPCPSGGYLGGISRKTRETILLCEAAGFDTIFIETVGIGQSEIEIDEIVDFVIVLMLPNAGDELQGIKRGIMEIADLILINKADGELKLRANITQQQLKNVIHLLSPKRSYWETKVLTISALKNIGIKEVWKVCSNFFKNREKIEQNRNLQLCKWFYFLIDEKLKNLFYNNKEIKSILKKYETLILQRKKTPMQCMLELIEIYLNLYKNKKKDDVLS